MPRLLYQTKAEQHLAWSMMCTYMKFIYVNICQDPLVLILACPIASVILAGWSVWHLQPHTLVDDSQHGIKPNHLQQTCPAAKWPGQAYFMVQNSSKCVNSISNCTLGSWRLLWVFVLLPVLASSVASPTAVSTPSAAESGSAPATTSLLRCSRSANSQLSKLMMHQLVMRHLVSE